MVNDKKLKKTVKLDQHKLMYTIMIAVFIYMLKRKFSNEQPSIHLVTKHLYLSHFGKTDVSDRTRESRINNFIESWFEIYLERISNENRFKNMNTDVESEDDEDEDDESESSGENESYITEDEEEVRELLQDDKEEYIPKVKISPVSSNKRKSSRKIPKQQSMNQTTKKQKKNESADDITYYGKEEYDEEDDQEIFEDAKLEKENQKRLEKEKENATSSNQQDSQVFTDLKTAYSNDLSEAVTPGQKMDVMFYFLLLVSVQVNDLLFQNNTCLHKDILLPLLKMVFQSRVISEDNRYLSKNNAEMLEFAKGFDVGIENVNYELKLLPYNKLSSRDFKFWIPGTIYRALIDNCIFEDDPMPYNNYRMMMDFVTGNYLKLRQQIRNILQEQIVKSLCVVDYYVGNIQSSACIAAALSLESVPDRKKDNIINFCFAVTLYEGSRLLLNILEHLRFNLTDSSKRTPLTKHRRFL
jgi:hypothetical protein